MREIHRSDFFTLTIDEERRIIRRTRTSQSFSTLAEIAATYEAMSHALGLIERPRYAVLVDVRLAPPRNDAAFEASISSRLHEMYGGFRRSASLVKTQAGRLQVMRMMKEAGLDVRVFIDESEAIAYLAAPVTSPPAARRTGPGGRDVGGR